MIVAAGTVGAFYSASLRHRLLSFLAQSPGLWFRSWRWNGARPWLCHWSSDAGARGGCAIYLVALSSAYPIFCARRLAKVYRYQWIAAGDRFIEKLHQYTHPNKQLVTVDFCLINFIIYQIPLFTLPGPNTCQLVFQAAFWSWEGIDTSV